MAKDLFPNGWRSGLRRLLTLVLATVIDAWPTVPEHIRNAVVGLVTAKY